MNSFYDLEELQKLHFKSIGAHVLISRKCSIYGAENMEIGSNVRIDDFCILSGKIKLKSYIHVAAYSALYGGDEGIIVDDFANISSRVCVYALSDDYSGMSMTNPMVPEEFKKVVRGAVKIGRHCIIGTGSTVMPGVDTGEGSAFGAYSFVNKSCTPWTVYAGIPCRAVKPRSRELEKLEVQFLTKQKI